MNKTFRLHRQHDMDLIALYRSEDFNFTKELKKALIAYANDLPYTPPPFEDTFAAGYVGTSVTFHISLSPTNAEQKKVLDLLGDVKYGYGNSFVKALFRSYLPVLPLSAYSKNNGLSTSRNAAVVPRVPKTTVPTPTVNTTSTAETTSTVDTTPTMKISGEKPSTQKEIPVENVLPENPIKVEMVETENPFPITSSVEEAAVVEESIVAEENTTTENTDGFDMSNFMAGLGNLAHSR